MEEFTDDSTPELDMSFLDEEEEGFEDFSVATPKYEGGVRTRKAYEREEAELEALEDRPAKRRKIRKIKRGKYAPPKKATEMEEESTPKTPRPWYRSAYTRKRKPEEEGKEEEEEEEEAKEAPALKRFRRILEEEKPKEIDFIEALPSLTDQEMEALIERETELKHGAADYSLVFFPKEKKDTVEWVKKNETDDSNQIKKLFKIGDEQLEEVIKIDRVHINYDLVKFRTITFTFTINEGKGIYPIYESIYECLRQALIKIMEEGGLPKIGGLQVKLKLSTFSSKIDESAESETESMYPFKHERWMSFKELRYTYHEITENAKAFLEKLALLIWLELEDPSEGMVYIIIIFVINVIDRTTSTSKLSRMTAVKTWDEPTQLTSEDLDTMEYYKDALVQVGFCAEKNSKIIFIKGCVLQTQKSIEGTCFFAAISNEIREKYEGHRIKIRGKVGKDLFYSAQKWLKEKNLRMLNGGVSIQEAEILQDFLDCDIEVQMFKEPNNPNSFEIETVYRPRVLSRTYFAKLFLYDNHWYRFIKQVIFFIFFSLE
ncbi:MAG: hypothetical protein QW303_01065 [Nitrososphaerota archaeon]